MIVAELANETLSPFLIDRVCLFFEAIPPVTINDDMFLNICVFANIEGHVVGTLHQLRVIKPIRHNSGSGEKHLPTFPADGQAAKCCAKTFSIVSGLPFTSDQDVNANV